MIEYIKDCTDCSAPSYPCEKSTCKHQHEKKITCDKCGQNISLEPYYEICNKQLCTDCAFKNQYSIDKAKSYILSDEEITKNLLDYVNSTDLDIYLNYVYTMLRTYGEDKLIEFVQEDKEDFLKFLKIERKWES